jgi:hypothetical protein
MSRREGVSTGFVIPEGDEKSTPSLKCALCIVTSGRRQLIKTEIYRHLSIFLALVSHDVYERGQVGVA